MTPPLIPGRPGLSAAALKYLGCLFMLADHLGILLFPQALWLRALGRLAFPIFAFMIANGYRHTAAPGKYLLRLTLFAAIFQWPYRLMLADGKLSVLFTLACGLAAVWAADALDHRLARRGVAYAAGLAAAAALAAIAQLATMDYGWYGVGLIYTAWLFFDERRLLAIAWALLTAALVASGWPALQLWSLAALIPLWLYNEQRGRGGRWFFYIFYPAHLIVLYLLRLLLI